jgi:hypothetical protein
MAPPIMPMTGRRLGRRRAVGLLEYGHACGDLQGKAQSGSCLKGEARPGRRVPTAGRVRPGASACQAGSRSAVVLNTVGFAKKAVDDLARPRLAFSCLRCRCPMARRTGARRQPSQGIRCLLGWPTPPKPRAPHSGTGVGAECSLPADAVRATPAGVCTMKPRRVLVAGLLFVLLVGTALVLLVPSPAAAGPRTDRWVLGDPDYVGGGRMGDPDQPSGGGGTNSAAGCTATIAGDPVEPVGGTTTKGLLWAAPNQGDPDEPSGGSRLLRLLWSRLWQVGLRRIP